MRQKYAFLARDRTDKPMNAVAGAKLNPQVYLFYIVVPK
jgi:hypothetical protein